jgi:hypothetical protein
VVHLVLDKESEQSEFKDLIKNSFTIQYNVFSFLDPGKMAHFGLSLLLN